MANAGPDQTIECAGPDGAPATLDGSASSDPDGDVLAFEWRDEASVVVGGAAIANVVVPLGSHLFSLTVADPGGLQAAATTRVTVQDTTPPVIAHVKASPRWLEPWDRLVPVRLHVSVADACDPGVSCKIVAVARRPGDDHHRDGQGGHDSHHYEAPDWVITGDLTLKLRAEPGRIYDITVQCTDGSGNAASRVVTVRVEREHEGHDHRH